MKAAQHTPSAPVANIAKAINKAFKAAGVVNKVATIDGPWAGYQSMWFERKVIDRKVQLAILKVLPKRTTLMYGGLTVKL